MNETSKGPKVKGALLVGMAMVINSTRATLNWGTDSRLTPQDLEIISKGIFASKWYDRSLYEKMGEGVYKVAGSNKPESAAIFGKGIMYDTLIKVYRGPLLSGETRDILTKFAEFYGTAWYNFGKAEFTPNQKGGVFHIFDPEGICFAEGYAAMISGVFSRLVKETGGRNVRVEAIHKKQPGTDKIVELILNINWE